MSPDGAPRKNDADSENDREPDQPHGHLGWDGWREFSRRATRERVTLNEPAPWPLGLIGSWRRVPGESVMFPLACYPERINWTRQHSVCASANKPQKTAVPCS